MSEKLKKSPQEIKDDKAFEILQNLDVESEGEDESKLEYAEEVKEESINEAEEMEAAREELENATAPVEEEIEFAEEAPEKPKPGVAKRAAVGTGKFLLGTSLAALEGSVLGAWKWIKLMTGETVEEIAKLIPGAGEIKKVFKYFFPSKERKS